MHQPAQLANFRESQLSPPSALRRRRVGTSQKRNAPASGSAAGLADAGGVIRGWSGLRPRQTVTDLAGFGGRLLLLRMASILSLPFGRVAVAGKRGTCATLYQGSR